MYQYICYFIIYSFLGWCMEVAYAAIDEEKFVNRGFLNGPVCPIYGFGMVIVVLLLTPLLENMVLLFIGAIVLASILELLTGFALEKTFHVKWWDYKNEPINLRGYICLKFSILWGIACVIVMEMLHPLIAIFVAIIPSVLAYVLISIILSLMGADIVVTVIAINKLNSQLGALQEISEKLHIISEGLGENIYEGVASMKEKTAGLSVEFKEGTEEIKIKTIELKEKAGEIKKKAESFVNNLADGIEESINDYKGKIENNNDELLKNYDNKTKEIILLNQKMTKAFEELKQNYRTEMHKSFFGQKRLIKAFPNLKPKNKNDIFNKLKKYL